MTPTAHPAREDFAARAAQRVTDAIRDFDALTASTSDLDELHRHWNRARTMAMDAIGCVDRIGDKVEELSKGAK